MLRSYRKKAAVLLFFIACIGCTGVINAQTSKTARKEARTLSKDGWVPLAGTASLDEQLQAVYELEYETGDDGSPAYIIGTGLNSSPALMASKAIATEMAKADLVEQMETRFAAIISTSVVNRQLTAEEAESAIKFAMRAKAVMQQQLGPTRVVLQMARPLPDGHTEVTIRVAYPARDGIGRLKNIVGDSLPQEENELKDKLNSLGN